MRLRLLGTGTPTPSRVMVWSDCMSKVVLLTDKAASWRDYFFENIHNKPGSQGAGFRIQDSGLRKVKSVAGTAVARWWCA